MNHLNLDGGVVIMTCQSYQNVLISIPTRPNRLDLFYRLHFEAFSAVFETVHTNTFPRQVPTSVGANNE